MCGTVSALSRMNTDEVTPARRCDPRATKKPKPTRETIQGINPLRSCRLIVWNESLPEGEVQLAARCSGVCQQQKKTANAIRGSALQKSTNSNARRSHVFISCFPKQVITASRTIRGRRAAPPTSVSFAAKGAELRSIREKSAPTCSGCQRQLAAMGRKPTANAWRAGTNESLPS